MIDRLPPRIRFVLWMMYSGTIGWLAAVGLSAMLDGRAVVPDASGLAVFFVILGYGALARKIPERFDHR